MIKRIIALLICLCFVFEQTGIAQVVPQPVMPAYLSNLSPVADRFRPIQLRSIEFDPLGNNFRLLLDKGDLKSLTPAQTEESSKKLFEYFRIGLALPDSMFWVNLRPDSPDNIIDPYLEMTDLGRVLLEADLQLKKDLSLFTSPDTQEGRKYWNKLYEKAALLYGDRDIEIPTVTRPWIVPGEIIIRSGERGAFVYKAVLKVMLEQDYIKDSPSLNLSDLKQKELNSYSSQLIRELIIPRLTREVNSSRRYASLRQVYYSLILAQWFKQQKNVIAGSVASPLRGAPSGGEEAISSVASQIDTRDLTGLTSGTKWDKDTYYKAYKKSFQQGEYDKKETVSSRNGLIVRQYISGGIVVSDGGSRYTVLQGPVDFFVDRGFVKVPLSAAGTALIIKQDGGEVPLTLGKYRQLSEELKEALRKEFLDRFTADPAAPNDETTTFILTEDIGMEKLLDVSSELDELDEKYFYDLRISLGRSPLWFLESIRLRNGGKGDYAFAAFSGNWYNKGKRTPSGPNSKQVAAYRKYLDRIGLSPEHIKECAIEHKKIILLEFIVSGSGLKSFLEILKEYAQENNAERELKEILILHLLVDYEKDLNDFDGFEVIQQVIRNDIIWRLMGRPSLGIENPYKNWEGIDIETYPISEISRDAALIRFRIMDYLDRKGLLPQNTYDDYHGKHGFKEGMIKNLDISAPEEMTIGVDLQQDGGDVRLTSREVDKNSKQDLRIISSDESEILAKKGIHRTRLPEAWVENLENGNELWLEFGNEYKFTLKSSAWSYQKSSLRLIDKEFGHFIDGHLATYIIGLAQANKDRTITIVDWGCGAGIALGELADILNNQKISNVRLVGFGNMYFSDWADISQKGVKFILDDAAAFEKYFKPGEINFIFSFWGLYHLFLKALREEFPLPEYLNAIHGLMSTRGGIILNVPKSKGVEKFLRGQGFVNFRPTTLGEHSISGFFRKIEKAPDDNSALQANSATVYRSEGIRDLIKRLHSSVPGEILKSEISPNDDYRNIPISTNLIVENAGVFRLKAYEPVSFPLIVDRMKLLEKDLLTLDSDEELKELSLWEKAAWIFKEYYQIHPFVDGNKRTAMLLIGEFLEEHGFPTQHIMDYLRAVSDQLSRQEFFTPEMLEYYAALGQAVFNDDIGRLSALFEEAAQSKVPEYLIVGMPGSIFGYPEDIIAIKVDKHDVQKDIDQYGLEAVMQDMREAYLEIHPAPVLGSDYSEYVTQLLGGMRSLLKKRDYLEISRSTDASRQDGGGRTIHWYKDQSKQDFLAREISQIARLISPGNIIDPKEFKDLSEIIDLRNIENLDEPSIETLNKLEKLYEQLLGVRVIIGGHKYTFEEIRDRFLEIYDELTGSDDLHQFAAQLDAREGAEIYKEDPVLFNQGLARLLGMDGPLGYMSGGSSGQRPLTWTEKIVLLEEVFHTPQDSSLAAILERLIRHRRLISFFCILNLGGSSFGVFSSGNLNEAWSPYGNPPTDKGITDDLSEEIARLYPGEIVHEVHIEGVRDMLLLKLTQERITNVSTVHAARVIVVEDSMMEKIGDQPYEQVICPGTFNGSFRELMEYVLNWAYVQPLDIVYVGDPLQIGLSSGNTSAPGYLDQANIALQTFEEECAAYQGDISEDIEKLKEARSEEYNSRLALSQEMPQDREKLEKRHSNAEVEMKRLGDKLVDVVNARQVYYNALHVIASDEGNAVYLFTHPAELDELVSEYIVKIWGQDEKNALESSIRSDLTDALPRYKILSVPDSGTDPYLKQLFSPEAVEILKTAKFINDPIIYNAGAFYNPSDASVHVQNVAKEGFVHECAHHIYINYLSKQPEFEHDFVRAMVELAKMDPDAKENLQYSEAIREAHKYVFEKWRRDIVLNEQFWNDIENGGTQAQKDTADVGEMYASFCSFLCGWYDKGPHQVPKEIYESFDWIFNENSPEPYYIQFKKTNVQNDVFKLILNYQLLINQEEEYISTYDSDWQDDVKLYDDSAVDTDRADSIDKLQDREYNVERIISSFNTEEERLLALEYISASIKSLSGILKNYKNRRMLSELKEARQKIQKSIPGDNPPVAKDGGKVKADGGSQQLKPDTGGIDLRALPASGQQQPVNMPQVMLEMQKLAQNAHITDMDKEWRDIEFQICSKKDMPYTRIKEYIAVCAMRPDCRQYMDKTVGCVLNILRIEEEQALATKDELKDILLCLG